MVARTEIIAAAERLTPYIRRTPTIVIDVTINGRRIQVALKLEFLQHSGSFKARGAFNRLLTAGEANRSIVAASGGNHGAAVAYAANVLGRPATIFVPTPTPATKVERILSYHAKVEQNGANYAEAYALSQRLAESSGALEVHAYDDAAVLAGQGTVAVEFDQDVPDLTHVLVAVGGGGLVGGIASWFDGTGTTVIGVEPVACPSLERALEAGKPVPVEVGGLAADSLGARQVGALMYDVAERTDLAVVPVTDAAIRSAQVWLWDQLRIIAEPGGAAALAAILDGAWVPPVGSRVGVVLCGANTSPASLA